MADPVTAPAARTLAEIVAEGRQLEAEQAEARSVSALDPFGPDFAAALALGNAALAVGRFYRQHGPALLAVAEKTLALFIILDYVEPGWRGETCTVGGDEVNRAWYELEKSLGLGPDAVRGEEKTS